MFKRDDSLYVNDMLESIAMIQQFVKGMDYKVFLSDRKTYSATVRELEVIGEASGKISETLKAQHPEIDWRTIKDFRNILAHEYFSINSEILWDIVQNKLEPLKNQIAALVKNN